MRNLTSFGKMSKIKQSYSMETFQDCQERKECQLESSYSWEEMQHQNLIMTRYFQLRVLIFKNIKLPKQKSHPRPVLMMELQGNKFLRLEPQNAVNFQKLFLAVLSQIKKNVETIYVSWRKVETCYNLVSQFLIFYTHFVLTHISFSLNKSDFHMKQRSRIFTDNFNKTNVNILQFNIVSLRIKQFIIFEKFSWNSFWLFQGVIMNLIELTFTKLSILYKTLKNKATFFLYS